MSFENIQLPSSLIADLYKQSLVVLEEEQQPVLKKPLPVTTAKIKTAEVSKGTSTAPVEKAPPQLAVNPVIKYRGGNQQRVSVLIKDADHADIAPEHLLFLQKMMAACKLTLDDLAIINIAHNQPAATTLWQVMPSKVLLMFGVQSGEIGLPFYRPDFQVQQWDNAQFMAAPPLSAFIGPDSPELRTLKRELWEGLQKIFLGK